MSTAAQTPVPEDCLGPRFAVSEVLGQGGMGVVYRAYDRELGREVAVKLNLDSTPQLDRRLRREGEALAKLRHPGIVQVHGSGALNGRPFLVCELVEGAQPLTQAWTPLPVAERARLLRDAALALGEAHSKGIVHRDLKPDNLLVDQSGHLRVTDFGVALLSGTTRLTRTGGMVGTPFYMAPEQFIGDRSRVGAHSDVWSLGVLLYQALTDELPFYSESLGQLGFVIAKANPKPPRALNPQAPQALAQVCARAIAKAPGDRFAHGTAFAEALDAALTRPDRPAPTRFTLGVLAALLGLVVTVSVLLLAPWEEAPATARRAPGDTPERKVSQPDPEPERRARALSDWKRLRTPLLKHVEGVRLLRAWPLATELGAVRVQLAANRGSKQPLAVFEANAGVNQNTQVAFGSDGTLFAVAGNLLTEWSLATEREQASPLILEQETADSLTRLRNGDLVSAGRASLNWIRADDSQLLTGRHVLSEPDREGTHLLLALPRGSVNVHEVATRGFVAALPGEHEPALALALSPDGTRAAAFVATVEEGTALTELVRGEFLVWDLKTLELTLRAPLTHRTRLAKFGPDGSWVLAAGATGNLRAFDVLTGERVKRFAPPAKHQTLMEERAHSGSIRGLEFCGPNRVLTVSDVAPGNPYGHQLRLWQLSDASLLWEIRPLRSTPTGLSVHHELELIAVGTSQGRVELYALPDAE